MSVQLGTQQPHSPNSDLAQYVQDHCTTLTSRILAEAYSFAQEAFWCSKPTNPPKVCARPFQIKDAEVGLIWRY
jgi:hypothetical protein